MLEIAQPVHAIVADHAFCAECLDVIEHKCRVMLVMAINACLEVKYLQILGMACGTGDRLFGIIQIVLCKAKPNCL